MSPSALGAVVEIRRTQRKPNQFVADAEDAKLGPQQTRLHEARITPDRRAGRELGRERVEVAGQFAAGRGLLDQRAAQRAARGGKLVGEQGARHFEPVARSEK